MLKRSKWRLRTRSCRAQSGSGSRSSATSTPRRPKPAKMSHACAPSSFSSNKTLSRPRRSASTPPTSPPTKYTGTTTRRAQPNVSPYQNCTILKCPGRSRDLSHLWNLCTESSSATVCSQQKHRRTWRGGFSFLQCLALNSCVSFWRYCKVTVTGQESKLHTE